MKIGFISLGCSKNLVDTEFMMGFLKRAGHEIVNKTEEAEAIIINTCGFINDAKQEAIREILDIGTNKARTGTKILIASGCLTQRYSMDLWEEIPELDGILGVTGQEKIDSIISRCAQGERVFAVENWAPEYSVTGPRIISTSQGFAYLKIAEGCSNNCTYCAIPNIRGPLRSRPLKELVEEAKWLASEGRKELIIIAQDITAYGKDSDVDLEQLLKALNDLPEIEWLRLMYAYPNSITDGLIEIMQGSKVVPYLDMPIQHASDRILLRMGRRYGQSDIIESVNKLRLKVPKIALRTTLMTGFPGESSSDHQHNIDLLRELEFDWVGVFTYSNEEGTAASRFIDDVPQEIKNQRLDELMVIQQDITSSINQKRIGSTVPVIIEKRANGQKYSGRSVFQAPDVDGVCIINSHQTLTPGQIIEAKIVKADGYDLVGTFES